jgi:peptidoglycan/xylan/chitin deacetylase (PgdA/CDA1 family)
MRRGCESWRRWVGAALLGVATAVGAVEPCAKPVYLTFDTGHMGVAPLVAEVLLRQQVKVTFFLADEKTLTGGSSLDAQWAPWWKARAAEGHVFGSHTLDHVYWRRDRPGGRFEMRPSAGPAAGHSREMDGAAYCAELDRSARRFGEMTGQRMAPLFRAPGGRTSPALRAAAQACGWQHVGWAPAGFLGDELPSDRYPNARLLQRALRDIRAGDILMAHLGIWSRQDPWAPAVLEPLIVGLKQRGLCFATLAEHPTYRAAVQSGSKP